MIFAQIMVTVLIFFILYLCIYALVNRICRCVEHCATARAYSRLVEKGVSIKMNGIDAAIRKGNMEVGHVETRTDKK